MNKPVVLAIAMYRSFMANLSSDTLSCQAKCAGNPISTSIPYGNTIPM